MFSAVRWTPTNLSRRSLTVVLELTLPPDGSSFTSFPIQTFDPCFLVTFNLDHGELCSVCLCLAFGCRCAHRLIRITDRSHGLAPSSLLLPLPPLCGDFPTVPPARVGHRPGFDNDPGASNPIGGWGSCPAAVRGRALAIAALIASIATFYPPV